MKALVPLRTEGFFHILHKIFTLVFSLSLARYGRIRETMENGGIYPCTLSKMHFGALADRSVEMF